MNANERSEVSVAKIAAAIGDRARAQMLYCLMDGRARTSTELATVAEISPSTASVHLRRLQERRLVNVLPQGKHRYYSLQGAGVAAALEALSVLAGGARDNFVPNTPHRLRSARTCYDHIAGTLGVMLHDRFTAMGWLSSGCGNGDNGCDLTTRGAAALESLGLDVEETRGLRRRFAYGCVDWSERRPHLGGALGAALLDLLLKRKWVIQDLDSRALTITGAGRREMLRRFEIRM
jgi:DNA-binding transcriptional ArsR family regulator